MQWFAVKNSDCRLVCVWYYQHGSCVRKCINLTYTCSQHLDISTKHNNIIRPSRNKPIYCFRSGRTSPKIILAKWVSDRVGGVKRSLDLMLRRTREGGCESRSGFFPIYFLFSQSELLIESLEVRSAESRAERARRFVFHMVWLHENFGLLTSTLWAGRIVSCHIV